MGCSFSKREQKKPTKYDFLPQEGKQDYPRDAYSDGEKALKGKPNKSYTQLQSDHKAPPSEVNTYHPQPHNHTLPIIDEFFRAETDNIQQSKFAACRLPDIRGVKKTPMPDFDPTSTTCTGQRIDLWTLRHNQPNSPITFDQGRAGVQPKVKA